MIKAKKLKHEELIKCRENIQEAKENQDQKNQ